MMSRNPFNLVLRFVLELAALVAMGYWGWATHNGPLRYLLLIGMPVVASLLWGIFRVPNDGGRPVVRVPGVVRFWLEVLYFGFAIWALFNAGATLAGWIMEIATIVHYVISYDRVRWLLKQ